MLYIIIPYFNFENNIFREKNLYKFVNQYRSIDNVKIIISEAFIDESSSELKNLNEKIFKHLKFITKQKLWVKENLINLAIKELPDEANYIAWIDGDIEFNNLNWHNEIINKLEEYDIIQLFENVIHLDKTNQQINTGYIKENIILSKYGQPGFGWAFKRSIINKIGGFLEYDIVGMGDNFMARCFNNKIPFIHPKLKSKIKTSGTIIPTSINYYNILSTYYNKCKGYKIGYLNGSIKHFWHGDLNKRLYVERWKILESANYDPETHLIKNEFGLIQINTKYLDLLKNLENYFNAREKIV